MGTDPDRFIGKWLFNFQTLKLSNFPTLDFAGAHPLLPFGRFGDIINALEQIWVDL